MQSILKECCISNYEQAISSVKMNVDRIEFCSQLHEGGLTPDYQDLIRFLQNELVINHKPKIVIMARPRPGDFIYDITEIESIKKVINEIAIIKQNYDSYNLIEGVVTGVLIEEFGDVQINYSIMREIVNLCTKHDLYVVFHMAIDEIDDIIDNLKQLDSIQIKRILTKGGNYKSAIEGKPKIKEMIQYVKQNKLNIQILPGKGINHSNIDQFMEGMDGLINEVHGSQIVGNIN